MAAEILIKGMVCTRCVSVIKEGIDALGYEVDKISLGKLSFREEPGPHGRERIGAFLRANGFELISDRHVRTVNRVKELIHEVFTSDRHNDSRFKFPALLSEDLHMNYDSISELFTRLEGITLEKYVINKRLEKVTELLVYTDRTLTEIAAVMGFSSINHLSSQFKQLTGHAPSHFKAIRKAKTMVSPPTAGSKSLDTVNHVR